MEKVFQVFVSSTYADLANERGYVSETLAKAGYIPAGMELFPATDQQQLEFIKRVIDRCDYYVVIIGGRYGSLADDNVSFTEKEFEYALSKGIPILAFLHKNPETIEVGKTDQNFAQAERLLAFRNRLATGRIVDYWTNGQDLCTKVVIAVTQAINLSPGTGWVRGDQAIDAKVVQDLERLRIENEDLKARLSELDPSVVSFPPHIAGPNSEFVLNFYHGGNGTAATAKKKFQFTLAWKTIFLESIDQILKEVAEVYIVNNLAKIHATEAGATPEEARFIYADVNDIRSIRFQLEALGLVKTIARSKEAEGRSYNITTWEITEKGRRFMAENLAQRNII